MQMQNRSLTVWKKLPRGSEWIGIGLLVLFVQWGCKYGDIRVTTKDAHSLSVDSGDIPRLDTAVDVAVAVVHRPDSSAMRWDSAMSNPVDSSMFQLQDGNSSQDRSLISPEDLKRMDIQSITGGNMVTWIVENTSAIGEWRMTTVGNPKITNAPVGKAVCFNGTTDALIVPHNPLEGLSRFTVEVLFRPDSLGPSEQRFVHLQSDGDGNNRVMLETRVNSKVWYLDTFLKSGNQSQTLVDSAAKHPTDGWYWASLTYDGTTMRAYVNGILETSGNVEFAPLAKGKTGLGMRLDATSPFQGCIREIRFHDAALPPAMLQRMAG